jgi:hypothetical protein
MSAEEKILQGILQDAKLQADKIIANGKTEETAILEEGKAQAKAYSAQTVSAALIKAKAIKTNAESAANLTVRDIILAKKHSEIEKTLGLIAANCFISPKTASILHKEFESNEAKEVFKRLMNMSEEEREKIKNEL